jgi:hypothetical protein
MPQEQREETVTLGSSNPLLQEPPSGPAATAFLRIFCGEVARYLHHRRIMVANDIGEARNRGALSVIRRSTSSRKWSPFLLEKTR